ncbi:MAG TPA: tetratricopeptide repeat protein [Rhizomicrobium sp.]|nr:tetratricopeptide repeat protein [Rhizomicrobium sp.]
MSSAAVERKSRLQSLLTFLEKDPRNLPLLADAAGAAFDGKAYDVAADLIARYAAIATLPGSLLNLQGMIALAEQHYDVAAAVFATLHERNPAEPALAFNLAWANAMMNRWEETLALLDDATLAASPRAPSLKIQALHHLGRYEDALAAGETLAERFPDNEALMGALATLAMDAEKLELAQAYAARGAGSAEGSAALGFIALGDHDVRALALFDQAIATDPRNPRAWIGKGLGLLAAGDAQKGAEAIDRGAAIFGDHIGSWIASGWAHFARGDNAAARRSFERAMAIDPNFSECHGAVAVMEFLDGNIAAAEKECEIALRLDRKSFGGALAKVLLLDRSGNKQAAQRVRDMAFAVPIGPRGETLAQLLAGAGSRLSR